MTDANKKYKKKSEDKFISYILIGFSVAFFAVILGVILFNLNNKPLVYDNFTHIEDKQTIYTESEDQYLVYFYQDECGGCKVLKPEILSFADSNKNDLKVYFVNTYVARTTGNLVIPTEIHYTPSIMLISNGVYVDFAVGAGEESNEIPALLDEINAGENAYIK